MNGCFLFQSGCCGASAFRVLRRQRLDPIDRKNDLEIHRLLGPQRAVVVEGGDALVRRHEIRAALGCERGMKSVIDFFTVPSFQEGRGSAGACAWVVPNQQRPAISTIVFRARWKDGRSIGSSHRGTLLPGVRENFATLRLAHPYHQDCVASMVQSRTSISAIGSRRERFAAHDSPKHLEIFSLGASRRPSGRSTIRPGCAGPPVAQGNEHQRAGVKHVI